MATLALSLAGQMVGGLVGGPFGATIGRALGGLAGSAIDGALFGPDTASAPVPDVRVTGANEGAPIQRVYGWNRVAGTVIWTSDLEKIASEDGGAKGFAPAQDEEIVASFALALCEGEIAHVGRIWADGKVLDPGTLTIRLHRGTESQAPDPFIVARQGEGAVPGYRGLAYLVFERLPLKGFGNRLPNLTVEVCRVVGDLEPAIRAVCVIPGSTEFGYDPEPRVRLMAFGTARSENVHQSALRSDWDCSIEELTALCPNLVHVGIVVAWFGTDLRCGQCVVEPRVENATKTVRGTQWQVAGVTRASANVVSEHQGGPAYGGTPSDASVRAAIADLKARGLKVTLYPFVMMDIPAGNALPDPYGAAAQAPYPWRGRITCTPAPGRPGTVDKSPAAAAQVSAFVAGGYRDMVLHYADLAQEAGGVDAFLVGSELVGLTTVRAGAASFPFVDALREMAGAVRARVGSATRISYGADWTEYSGLQPADAPGDKLFHLDALWADPAIDAIAIDNYMPLADWRDQGDPGDPDADLYDLAYLGANVARGEGYDWFYASEADRQAGVRTPITDGAHGEPWIYRYKDLVGFWSRPHHDRVGGVRNATPTAWVPASKPIWLTEIGCGAIDKGANAPNAFGDPKSAEDRRPYFSTGAPDALMQRQALRALHRHWQQAGEEANPVSATYGGSMVDPERLYVWCWDARPFPAFPDRDDVWADAPNYEIGHWLNGRLGIGGSAEMIEALARDYGVTLGAVAAAAPAVVGLAVGTVTSLREAMAPLLAASGLVVRDTPWGLEFFRPRAGAGYAIAPEHLLAAQGPVLSRRRGEAGAQIGRLSLASLDRGRDYQSVAVIALAPEGEGAGSETLPLVLEPADARTAAGNRLVALARALDRIEAVLGPETLALEPGDLIKMQGVADTAFLVEEIRDGAGRAITATAWVDGTAAALPSPRRRSAARMSAPVAPPYVVAAHLPAIEGPGSELVLAGRAEPWPGGITVWDPARETELALLGRSAVVGALRSPLGVASAAVWSRHTLEIGLASGHLASRDRLAVLGGANRLAVQSDDGEWEVIGFAEAELLAPGHYRIGHLLRGQRGTVPANASTGQPVFVLDAGLPVVPVPPERIGEEWPLVAFGGARDGVGVPVEASIGRPPATPLAPVHARALRLGSGDLVCTWIRRTRRDGDVWTFGEVPLDESVERYRVEIWGESEPVRVIETETSGFTYALAHQDADFGGPAVAAAISVQQSSPLTGPGARAWITTPAV